MRALSRRTAGQNMKRPDMRLQRRPGLTLNPIRKGSGMASSEDTDLPSFRQTDDFEPCWPDEGEMAATLQRILNYGVPYKIYADAFLDADGDRSASECSNVLHNLLAAAVWGAQNAKHVLTVRELENMDDLEDDVEGEE